MKKIALALSLITTLCSAQVPRLSLIEEFTGENCWPCASTDYSFDVLVQDSPNSSLAEVIKWMVPIPTAPTPTWSLYKTNKTEIDWRYRSNTAGGYGYNAPQSATTPGTVTGINAVPAVLIDGQSIWPLGTVTNHAANVSHTVILARQVVGSPFSVTMLKALNQNQTAIQLTVTIVAAQSYSTNANLVFRAVMIERNVQFSVAPGTSGQTSFLNPVIASFPNIQSGTALPLSWTTGQSMTFTLNCPIPLYCRNVNQADMVGFIQNDDNQRIEQAVRSSTCTMATLSISASRTEVCAGESVTLAVSGAGSYSWSGGQTSATLTVTINNDMDLWVKSTDPGACSNVAAVGLRVGACTGFPEFSEPVHYDLYPNPSDGNLIIQLQTTTDNASLHIFDLSGRKVFQQAVSAGKTPMDTGLSPGVYMTGLSTNDRTPQVYRKLVVR